MDTAAARELSDPIIIYRSVDRDGQTFSLEPLSLDRVRERFGEQVHVRPLVFIAHETSANDNGLAADLIAQVVQLLAGVSEAKLAELGGVSLRDPGTDEELERS